MDTASTAPQGACPKWDIVRAAEQSAMPKIVRNAVLHMYVYSACKLFYSSMSAFLYFIIMYMMSLIYTKQS